MATINQAKFTIAEFSILELSQMATALTGEQSPINTKSVYAINESFIDGTPLLEPLHVTELNGIKYLTSGRHRAASLCNEYASNLDYIVDCLLFKVSTPEELLQRIKSPNMSRKVSSSENKSLDVACKFGFSSLTVEELCFRAPTAKDTYELFTLALAMSLRSTDFGDNNLSDVGSLKVAQAIVTQLKKIKRTVNVHETTDTDGTVLTPATKYTFKVLDDTLAGKSDDVSSFVNGTYTEAGITEIAESLGCDGTMADIKNTLIRDELISMIDDIVNTVKYTQTATLMLPAKVYINGKLKGVLTNVANEHVTDGTVTYSTVLGMPSDWQRKAAPWANVFMAPLTEALS